MRLLLAIENMIVITKTLLENTQLFLIHFIRSLNRIQQQTLNCLMKIKKIEFKDFLNEKQLTDKQNLN